MVSLVRNSLCYVSSKDYKAFMASFKKLYEYLYLKSSQSQLETFRQQWSQYPGAIDGWV
ncbi:hypothetical protein D8Y00_03695 [Listeria ivanovii]|nr:hypothetical protein [Listeria ivanovii]